MPTLFTASGYADTRPLESAISPKDSTNRRVEILILKNKYKNRTGKNDLSVNLTKQQQDEIQRRRAEIIKTVQTDSISPAARQLLEDNKKRIEKQKSEKLSKKNQDIYLRIDKELPSKKTDMPTIEKRVIDLRTAIPTDEDFGL